MGHVAEEIRICLISLYGGMLIGLIYDVSAFIRLLFGEGRLISAVFDALFYVAAGCMAALIFLIADEGRIRLYSVICIFLGVLLYCRFPMRLIGASIRHKLNALIKSKKAAYRKNKA